MKLQPPPIDFEKVDLTYTTATGPISVFSGLSLHVPAGQFLSVVGKSGCGKSSLLKLVGSLIKPTAGRVKVGDADASSARREGRFSYCFQDPVLFGWRDCLENVRLPVDIKQRSGRLDPVQVLGMVGLSGWEHRYPHELSGGMKQRVALARALSYEASILVLDEPFAGVDEISRTHLNKQLTDLWRMLGFTCLLTTHSVMEAVALSDRVIVLGERGRGIQLDLPVPLTRPRSDEILESDVFRRLVRDLRMELGL